MSLVVPRPIRDLPLQVLDLPTATREAIWRADVRTVGELAEALASGRLARIRTLGAATVAAIAEAVGAAMKAPERYVARAAEIELPVLLELDPGERPPNLIRLLRPLAGALWEHMASHWGSVNAYPVMRDRYGLEGGSGFALQEIGSALGVSRQRVHQIQRRALRQLQDALVGGRPPFGVQMPAAIIAEAQALAQLLAAGGPVWRQGELFELFENRYRVNLTSESSGSLRLLLETLGLQRPRSPVLQEPYWYWADKSLSVAQLDRAVLAVARALRQDEAPRSLTELVSVASSGADGPLQPNYVRYAIRLNSCIEAVGEDQYQLRFECLPSHAKRACRILRERGAPMGLTELAREINHRLVAAGQAPRSVKSVRQQLLRDRRLVSFGRGRWGLERWRVAASGPSNQPEPTVT